LGNFIESPISEAGGNQGDDSGAAIESEINRAPCPIERFGLSEKRRLEQNESPKLDFMPAQKLGRAGKLVERHSFVEFLENLGMGRFQSHRNFQLAAQQIAEAQARFADERRMTFYNDSLETSHTRSNRLVILDWDCM